MTNFDFAAIDLQLSLIIESFILSLLLILTILFVFSKNLYFAIIYLIFFSLCMAIMYIAMYAPDVSMTEAAIGASLTTIFPFLTLHYIKADNQSNDKIKFSFIAIITALTLIICLAIFSYMLPEYGNLKAPIHHYTANSYITSSGEEIGIVSVVASILASYRGYDTFGETVVILTAGLCVTLLLYEKKITPMNKSSNDIILSSTLKLLLPIILLYSLYIQFHGEISPGGGFQAGAILATAMILVCLITNIKYFLQFISVKLLTKLSGLGVAIYGLVGIFSMIRGGNFLEYSLLLDNKINGQKLGIFIIELGVGITVFAVLTLMFILFASRQNYDN